MIPIVEDYLSELISSKLSLLKKNPDYLDKILATDTHRLSALKSFISKKPVKVVKGYPRTPAEVPCICILLSNDNENQDSLGDYGGDGEDDIRSCTEELHVVDSPEGKILAPYVEVSRKPLVEISRIVHNDTGMPIEERDYLVSDYRLGLVQMYTALAEHNDSVTVSYTYKHSTTELSEVQYEANFRLEVWANNGDLVIQLYNLLKWVLLSGRDHLSFNKGLYRQRLSGTDFEPAPSYFPEFVYRRGLLFWCQYGVSTPGEEIPYIQKVKANLLVGGDKNGY